MILARAFATLVASACFLLPATGQAWGDEGHEVIALIADHFLLPKARGRLHELLQDDAGDLVADRGIAGEATWADRLRDSDRNGSQVHYLATREWHFINLELADPNLDAACAGHPPLPPASPASAGPAHDCIVDKIEQFQRELADPATEAKERLKALQFLLHLVGDLHQPLHAADDRDRGGNDKRVRAAGMPAGSLHHYWDTEFVRLAGRDPAAMARTLGRGISPRQRRYWTRGAAADWAIQSYQVARREVYGRLPAADQHGQYPLDARYVAAAVGTVRGQLRRAGVRLAYVLNQALTP